ncbi:MAG: methylenetetrahydrofolate reductase [Acidimicrobiales bacterium]
MPKITDLLAHGPTFSFEFFPPKNDEEQARLVRTLRELEPLEPSFVSVTYRGGRSSRERTTRLVTGMLRTTALTPMAHLICVAHSRLELAEILVDMRRGGVENLMALGGDPPTDADAGPGELQHAIELVELARAIGGFAIGVAAHPQGHPRSPDMPGDRRHLAEKLRLADFGVTQFFFRADDYLRLIDELEPFGLDRPIVPGIMPITSLGGVKRMAELSGYEVPAEVIGRIESAGDDPADIRRAGVEVATELCQRLLDTGAPGLHFYTLNRSTATRDIYASLGLDRHRAAAAS